MATSRNAYYRPKNHILPNRMYAKNLSCQTNQFGFLCHNDLLLLFFENRENALSIRAIILFRFILRSRSVY